MSTEVDEWLGDFPATISVERAGEILGVSRRSAYRAVARGQIPTIRLGRRLQVPTAALLRLLGIERAVDVRDLVAADEP